MPVYQYKAFDDRGQSVDGHIEANNLVMARSKLRSQGIYVKDLKEDTSSRDRELFPMLSKLLYRIPRKDIGLFVDHLGTLLGAGIALDVALNDIWEQTDNVHFKKIIAQIKEDIGQGKTLSEALAEHENIFPPVYENMVKVGEATGSYEPTLKRLAELEEKNAELKNKAITALIYPAIMLILSVAVVFFLLIYVVPQIETLFASFKAELPLPTKIVLSVSKFVQNFWYVVIIGTVAAVVGVQAYRQTPDGRRRFDAFTLRIPFFGNLLKKVQVSRFARNLGVLVQSNVQLLTALEIVSGTTQNSIFEEELNQAAKQIREGSSLNESLRSSRFLPHMMKGMVAAGESSDRLAEMLLKTAQIIENDVDSSVRRLTTSIEPLMILVMGGLVGGIMAAVMMPLYHLTETMK